MNLARMLLLLLLVLAGGGGVAPPSAAQPRDAPAGEAAAAGAAARPTLTAADFDRLSSLLQDEARRAEFLRLLEALATASRAQAGPAAEGALPAPLRSVAAPAAETAELPGAAGTASPVRPVAAADASVSAAQPPQAAPTATTTTQPPQAAPPTTAAQPPQAAPPPPAAAQPTQAAPPPAAAQPSQPAAPPPTAQPTQAAPPPAATPPAAATPEAEPLIAPDTVGAQLLLALQGRIGFVADAVFDSAQAMADIPALWNALVGLAQDRVTRARILDAAWKLLLLLGAALALEWLVWRALAAPRRRLLAAAPTPAEPAAAPPVASEEVDDGSETGAAVPPPPPAQGPAGPWIRRLPLMLGRLVLDLLPVAGFALAVYGLMGMVRPLPTTQLAGLLIAHVYIGARCVFVLARALVSPGVPGMRLVPLSDEGADYCVVWLRRMLLVGLGGYVLADVGVSFGLSWTAYDTIANLTLLLISLMLVRIILQQRHNVAAALRAPPPEPGETIDAARRMLRRARNRLAEVWHLLAILWLLAVWVVSSLSVEDGLQRLFTASALALAVFAVAKGLDELLRCAIERAANPGPETARRWPGLAVRAATYGGPLRAVLTLGVAFGGLVLLLEAWGVRAMAWFTDGTLGGRLLDTLLTIGATLVLGILVWEAASSAIQRRLARLSHDSQAARGARVRTLLPMLRTMLGGVIFVFVVMSVLSQLGVNVAPLLAGAGVVGVAVGFGSQTLVRDVITGIFLLLEDAMAVGDVVSLGGLSGVVEHLSIRSIKLRALDGSLHIIPFSAVTTVTNMTRDFSFAVLDVRVGYGEDPDHVAEVLKEISKEMRAEPKWQTQMRDEIEVMGIESFGDSGILIRARAKTEPAARWNVMREFHRRIKRRFAELGIEIPYPYQRVVVDQPDPRFPPPAAAAAAPKAAE
jgi:moderate conductance mechanosensitive channel